MKIYTVRYLLKTSLLDTQEIPSPFPFPISVAFFCNDCGEIWGRILFLSEKIIWNVQTVACEKHQPGKFDHVQIAGSFLEDDFLEVTEARAAFWCQTLTYIPYKVLKREFNLTLRKI